MNPRIYKKLCKRAERYIELLDKQGSHGGGTFAGTDDQDELPAPRGMKAPIDRHGDFVPLHNTRVAVYKTSYEYDEWDFMSTLEWLRDMMYWTFVEIADPGPVEDIKMNLTIPLTTWRDVFAAAERALAGDVPPDDFLD